MFGVVLDLACILTKKSMCPHLYGQQEGRPVGGSSGWGGGLEGLSCNVGDTSSRWSHMCSIWYFPRFLLRVGSWMWMNMASLMVLEWLLTSLCTMLNWTGSIGCPVVVLCRWMREGTLKCSLTLSPNDLPDSPYICTGAVYLEVLVVINDPCLIDFRILVLRVT